MSYSIFKVHVNGIIVIDSLHLYFIQNYAFEILTSSMQMQFIFTVVLFNYINIQFMYSTGSLENFFVVVKNSAVLDIPDYTSC